MQRQQQQQRAASAERQDQGPEQVPSASRSNSISELQAAASAIGDRQQQRRAALCKLANQA
jgi:hypothetical protein